LALVWRLRCGVGYPAVIRSALPLVVLASLWGAREVRAACQDVSLSSSGCTSVEVARVSKTLEEQGLRAELAGAKGVGVQLTCSNRLETHEAGKAYGHAPISVQTQVRSLMLAVKTGYVPAIELPFDPSGGAQLRGFLDANARSVRINAPTGLEYEVNEPPLGRATGTAVLNCLPNVQRVVVRVGELEFAADAPAQSELSIAATVPAITFIDYTPSVPWPARPTVRACTAIQHQSCPGPMDDTQRLRLEYETARPHPVTTLDWLPGKPSQELESAKAYQLDTEWASKIEATVHSEGLAASFQVNVAVPKLFYVCARAPDNLKDLCCQTVPWGPIAVLVLTTGFGAWAVQRVRKWCEREKPAAP